MAVKKFIKIIVLVFLVSLPLHFLWELLHSLLYNVSQLPYNNYILILIRATVADGIFMVLFYIIGLVKNKNLDWINRLKKGDYFLILISGLILSVINEIINVQYLGRWSYTPLMPTFFNVGLTPVLQLMILPFVVFWIVNKIKH